MTLAMLLVLISHHKGLTLLLIVIIALHYHKSCANVSAQQ